VRRRFGRLALAVGALALIVALIARRREDVDAVTRESYGALRERFEKARERVRERVQERGQEAGEEPTRGTEEAERREEREGTKGHRAYFRKLIEETNKRASGKA
jgi:hypothetical protein